MSILALTSWNFSGCANHNRHAQAGWLRRPRSGIAIAVVALIAIAAFTVEAESRSRGGGGGVSMGGRGGGGGGIGMGGRGGGAGFGRIGGGGGWSGRSVRSFGSPRVGGTGIRSFSIPRSGRAGLGVRSPGGHRLVRQTVHPTRSAIHAPSGRTAGRFASASTRMAKAPGSLARHSTRGQAVLGKRAITNTAWRSTIAPVRYCGRFRGSPWPWWFGGIVVGWVGPVFWPYIYYDFFDYVFWPYVYDDFWLYAYDDVYYGVYGSYAYDARPRVASRRVARADTTHQRPASICSGRVANLTDWPIERIAATVQPTAVQRIALDEFREASTKAVDLLRDSCPNDLPSTPVGRLAAMESRLAAMLMAVRTIRPSLDGFYQALDAEQKARFNAVAPQNEAAADRDRRDLTRLCDPRTPAVTDLPIDRIARAVQPNETQRAALDELNDASLKAAAILKADCPAYRALTPVGRAESMEQRLEATLTAVKTVKPALDRFYGLLSDEQKARFNELRSAGGAQG